MPVVRKYSDELRRRAIEMVLGIREREGKGHGEIARVSRQLGIHPESLRGWMRDQELDDRQRRDGIDAERIDELERQVAELRETVEALSAAVIGDWSLPEMRSGSPEVRSDPCSPATPASQTPQHGRSNRTSRT
jgi:transposase